MATLTDITGVGPTLARRLQSAGFTTVGAVASATPAKLAEVQGLSAATAQAVIDQAKKAPVKKVAAKKAPVKKVAAKKAPGDKTPPKKSRSKKPAGENTPPKKSGSKKKSRADLAANVTKLERRIHKLEKQLAKLSKAQRPTKKKKKK